jgi:hypothetical protein
MIGEYDTFGYLYPPRPEKAILPEMLGIYERQKWIAQAKKNGTCAVVWVSPDKAVTSMNRHAEDHKLWSPTPDSSRLLSRLKGKGWNVFVAELLHSKVSGGPRDTLYLNDALVLDGAYLVGRTYHERYSAMFRAFHDSGMMPEGAEATHFIMDSNLWIARNFTAGFRASGTA